MRLCRLPIRISCLSLALLAGLAGAAAPGWSQPPCGGQTPCFESNDDLLDGQRDLLPVDDVTFLHATSGLAAIDWQIVEMDDLMQNPAEISGKVVELGCSATPAVAAPLQNRVGRLWPLSKDVLVNLTPTAAASGGDCSTASGANLQLAVTVRGSSAQGSVTPFRADALWAQIAVGDVDRDGLDEVVFVNGAQILIFDAVDPGDPVTGDPGNPAAGLEPVGELALGGGATPLGPPRLADLNADGALELVWPAADPQDGAPIAIQLASVCPFANAVLQLPLGAHTCAAAFEIVPAVSIATGATLISIGTVVSPGVAIAMGNFDGSEPVGAGTAPDEELLFVGNQLRPGAADVQAFAYAFDASLNAAVPTTLTVHPSVGPEVWLDAGPLDGSSGQEQAVVGYKQPAVGEGNGVSAVDVIAFDTSLAMTAYHWTPPDSEYVSFGGVAIGRFDPPMDAEGNVDFDRQIAMLTPAVGFTTVSTFVVDPPDFTPRLVGPPPVTWPGEVLANTGPQVGDTSGRSMQLGEPTVVRIADHSEPSIVLGDPPKHVDFVPATLGAAPQIVNFTALRSFSAQFELAESSQTSSATTTVTSHSWSYTGSATEKISLNVPLVSRINGSFTQAWSRTGGSTNGTLNSQYASLGFDDTAQTQAADFLMGTSQDFNIYAYPVVGQTTCPMSIEVEGMELACDVNSGGGCTCSPDGTETSCSGVSDDPPATSCTTDGQCCNTPREPLAVQVSGPDTVVAYAYGATAPGRTEWYQPVHEPLNLLSYPWTFEQLEAEVPTSLVRLSTPVAFDTDSDPNNLSVSWSGGGTSGSSVGSNSSHSFQTSNSVTVGTPEVEKLATGNGVSVSGSFSYNSSDASSSLTDKQSTLAESLGAIVQKPGFDQSQVSLYSYGFDPVLFVQTPSPGVIQTLSGKCGPDGTSTCDLPLGGAGAGALRLQHTVDVTNAGTWWATGPYSAGNGLPDVALNHPSRWSFTATGTGSACVTAKQVGTLSNATVTDCVDPIPPIAQADLAAGLWGSEWHFLRGLFITVDAPSGPQRTTAIAGDQVFLGARVYNYSQRAMDADAIVRVQFYRQEIDPSTYSLVGDSVLVGEAQLDAIPPHNNPAANPQDLPNWSLAQVELDTTDLAAQAPTYWIFWVVAWAELDGALVQEVAYHGLDLDAPPTAPFSSIAAVPPQLVTVTDATGDAVQTSFTNNYGFYHVVFSVLPPGAAEALPPRRLAPALRIEDLRSVSRRSAAGGAPVVIEADLVSPGAPTSGAVVRLYEVERAGRRPVRRAIDEELLGHLEADRAYRVQVPYRPACGRRQEVELVVAEGHRTEARRTAIVHVPCERTIVCHGGRSLPVAGSAFAAHVRHGDPPGACVD